MLSTEILRQLAPYTPKGKRDRFLSYLNEAMPRYGIDTELRVAAFLATICFESDYFKATEEYKGKPGSTVWEKYQKKYWHTGMYGRGLIQLTKLPNYEAFNKHLQANRNGSMDAARATYPNLTVDVVDNPEIVAYPFFAVESACWYWQEHDLNSYADKGKFDQIQGLVNRGGAKKKALDLADRQKLYLKVLAILPDDFSFGPVASPPDGTVGAQGADTSQPALPLTSKVETFADSVIKPVNWVQDKLTEMRVDPSKISPASWFQTITTKGGGWLLGVMGFITNNYLYILAGVVLIAVGVWYFSKAKDRLDIRQVV